MNKSNISCKFNNISGDVKLNLIQKIYWILISILNFVLSIFDITDKRIKLIKFNNINKINLIKNYYYAHPFNSEGNYLGTP